VFDESWALREAINSKTIHVKAILDSLRKAQKYKSWLQDLPANANLIKEYTIKVGEKNILDRLPAKAIRFYFFNSLAFLLGGIKPELGIPFTVAANAFDSFLLSKLAEDWKPSQFIEGEFKKLLDK
jgi:hypothetical protein